MTNDEENYEEAIKAVNTAFGGGHIPTSLKAIFEDDASKNLNKQVSFMYQQGGLFNNLLRNISIGR